MTRAPGAGPPGGVGVVRVPAERLAGAVAACFTGLGVPSDDARAVADVLVYADERGLGTHGVHRAAAYLRRVRAGLAGGTERMVGVGGSGAVRRYDAGHALGPAAAVRAVDEAVALSRRHGVGLVALGRSTHLGAAGYYARRAARARAVALVTSNGPAAVAPHGAAEAFLGTNPLAIGIPLGRHGEFVLDMATSAIPRERVRMAAEAGEDLPPGVAVDADGRPTTDAAEAMRGSVAPVGGPKGSGLGLAVSLLAVLLGGGGRDAEIGSMYRDFDRPQDLGQVFLAVDPAGLGPPAEGTRRVEALIDALHALRPALGGDGTVAFPGERGEARAAQARAGGVPVAAAALEALATCCAEECGLPDAARGVRALLQV
ncbi:MAG TPA: Ldh family oxidoreductase [Pseudonocardia sp.]|nr:Ldh family oxidoreductase [Pseudonocardia sp.]